MMHSFHTVMEGLALIIDATASAIMVWAFLVAVYAFLKSSLASVATERIMRLQVARCDLGVKLVFALELLIISDLLHTVVSHTLDDLLFPAYVSTSFYTSGWITAGMADELAVLAGCIGCPTRCFHLSGSA